MNTVNSTEEVRPPMMARASGAYCSLPVPSFRAMGTIPMMVASEVIKIGRRRTRQEVITASSTDLPCSSRRCANSTIRMLLEAAMPTSIRTPISDITFRVVCVSGRITSTPMKPIGMASMIRNGILERTELRDQNQEEQNHRQRQADREAGKGFVHRLHHAAQIDADAGRKLLCRQQIADLRGDLAQVLAGGSDIHVRDALNLVMIDFRGRLYEVRRWRRFPES